MGGHDGYGWTGGLEGKKKRIPPYQPITERVYGFSLL